MGVETTTETFDTDKSDDNLESTVMQDEISETMAEENMGEPQPIEKKLFNLRSDKYNSDNIYVYIEKTNCQDIGRLHPMIVGHILHKKLNIKNIKEIKTVGRNRVKIQFNSIYEANNLVNNEFLASENLKAYIPSHLLETKGIIRGVDTNFDVEYLKENIISTSIVTDIKRTHKKITNSEGKIEFVPKQTIIVSFEGNILPKHVIINCVYAPVEQFIGRVTQCYNCLRFGHISKQCKSTMSRCITCGLEKNDQHRCNEKQVYCVHCKSREHVSISKKCPFYEKQKNIKTIMFEKKLSFSEAHRLHQNSYAGVTVHNQYDVLSNLEANFPTLPQNNFRADHTNIRNHTNKRVHLVESVSQPNPSTSAVDNFNKKRKASSPPPNEVMFPFRFGPSQPLPLNINSNPNVESQFLDNLMDCFSNYFVALLEHIRTLDNIPSIDSNVIKNDMKKVWEGTLNNP